jgi:hypothetical protein
MPDQAIIKRAVEPQKIRNPFATARITGGRQLSWATLSGEKQLLKPCIFYLYHRS